MLFKLFFKIFFFFGLKTVVDSSHFLGGSINWRIQNISDNGTSVAILITQTYSWTYIAGRCDGSAIANNQAVSNTAGTLTCSPSCPSGFGTVSAVPYCTDVSTLNGVAVGQRLDTVVIPTGSDFWVIYASTYWNNLIGGGTAGWSITSRINLIKRSDNNMFNNAPVATVMSPINIQANQTTLIIVSVSDADGDIVRCRWANASGSVNECGSVCSPTALPANTILYSNCTIEITAPSSGTAYGVTFIVEDFMTSSSTTPLSSAPVQFIVKVIAPSTCSILPEASITGQSCTTVKVNEVFTTPLLGLNYCGTNVSITDIATISFAGMVQTSLTKLNSIIYYKTLTWTPTTAQLGYQVMCAIALDSTNSQSPQYCFTFYVTENGTNSCPTASTNTTVASTLITTTVTTTVPNTTISTATITTTTSPSVSTIQWPIIAALSALVLIFAIIYSVWMIKRHYKRSAAKKRERSYNNNSAQNTPSLKSSRNHPTAAETIDSLLTVKSKTVKKSSAYQTHRNNEKVVHNEIEQIFVPYIIYPSGDNAQISLDEPDLHLQSNRGLSQIKSEKTHVKIVPLPIDQMITETRQSQIETIDLQPMRSVLAQLPEADNESIGLSNIARTENIYTVKNKIKTAGISEPPSKTTRKTNPKPKLTSGIHVRIRQTGRPNE